MDYKQALQRHNHTCGENITVKYVHRPQQQNKQQQQQNKQQWKLTTEKTESSHQGQRSARSVQPLPELRPFCTNTVRSATHHAHTSTASSTTSTNTSTMRQRQPEFSATGGPELVGTSYRRGGGVRCPYKLCHGYSTRSLVNYGSLHFQKKRIKTIMSIHDRYKLHLLPARNPNR